MFKNVTPERPTTDRYLDRIIDETSCKKHEAEAGDPCWGVAELSGLGRGAVCNSRAKKAGFNHPISIHALRLNRQKKR